MNRLLEELANLDEVLSYRLSVIYTQIGQIGQILLGVLVFNIILNAFGIRILSILFGLTGAAIILYMAYNPWFLLRPFGSAYLLTKLGDLGEKIHLLKKEEKKDKLIAQVLRIYNETILETVLWFTFLSLIIGVFPLWGRLKVGLIVVLALITFKVASTLLKKPPIFARVAYAVSVIIFLIGIGYMGVGILMDFPPIRAKVEAITGPLNFLPYEEVAKVLNAGEADIRKKRERKVAIQALEVMNKKVQDIDYPYTKLEKEFLRQAYSSNPKTLEEIEKELGGDKGELVMTIISSHNPEFADGFRKELPPGEYYQVPADNGQKTAYQFLGEKGPRPIGDGKNFTVPVGKKLVGVQTPHDVIKIYRKAV